LRASLGMKSNMFFVISCLVLPFFPFLPLLGIRSIRMKEFNVTMAIFLVTCFVSLLIALGIVFFLGFPIPLDVERQIDGVLLRFTLSFYGSFWIPLTYFSLLAASGAIWLKKRASTTSHL
jgi:hypothetical protein